MRLRIYLEINYNANYYRKPMPSIAIFLKVTQCDQNGRPVALVIEERISSDN